MLPYTGTNRYGDLLREFYDGLKNGNLSETRLGIIQNAFNELWLRESIYKSWLAPNGNVVFPADIRARGGYFDIVPLGYVLLERFNAQTIPNNTETVISFDTTNRASTATTPGFYAPASSRTLRFTLDDPTKIYLLNSGKQYALMGAIQWAQHATGRRAIQCNIYNTDGTLSFGTTLHTFVPSNVSDDVFPFASSFFIDNPNEAYFQVTVVQTSGVSLDVTDLRMYVFEIV